MTKARALKIKIQLYCGDEIAMGPGKADLLDAIREHRSISAAARCFGMSYRRAWLLVDTMNRCWQSPLVDTTPGRSKDGGARLTSLGETVLCHYRAIQGRAASACECDDVKALSASLRTAPKASQKA